MLQDTKSAFLENQKTELFSLPPQWLRNDRSRARKDIRTALATNAMLQGGLRWVCVSHQPCLEFAIEGGL